MDVMVLGVDPANGDERWRARIGVVPQSWRDHGRWKVRDLLAHLGSYHLYWLGLGIRSALLPAAAVEVAGSWRHLATAAILGAWAPAGLLIAPGVLRRMARRSPAPAWRPAASSTCNGSEP